MEKLVKMENDLFYMMRHLKTFKTLTNNDDSVWLYRWPNGSSIEIYNKKTNEILCTVESPHIAEYIVSLHNSSNNLVKEVESKYQLKG
jgi:hypothetical protein